jgi:TetR/AcrR family transcriptional regulator
MPGRKNISPDLRRKKSRLVEEPRNLRQQQSDDTRRRLLDASLQLFVHKGFAGTTVRDIAKAARVSPGLMFHYFPSKQAILQEHVRVIRSGVDQMAQRLNAAGDPLETFTEIARTILDSFREDYSKNLFLLANQVLSFDSIPPAAKKAVSATSSIEASVPLVIRGQRKQQFKRGAPLALVVAFWGALQGIAEVLIWNPNAPIPDPDVVVSILRA